jgi:hypothetical protein
MHQAQRPPSDGPPARTSLDHYTGIQKQLDGDIYHTNAEIRVLNNKIVK